MVSFVAGLFVGWCIPHHPKAKPDMSEHYYKAKAKENAYQKALKQSKETGQSIFLYFTKDCSECDQMKETMKNDEIKDRLSKFIWVEVDSKKTGLLEKWSVDGYPTCIIINSKEQPLKRKNGVLNVDDFIEWIGNF